MEILRGSTTFTTGCMLIWVAAHAVLALLTRFAPQFRITNDFDAAFWPFDPLFAPGALLLQIVFLGGMGYIRPSFVVGCATIVSPVLAWVATPTGPLLAYMVGTATRLDVLAHALVYAAALFPAAILAAAFWLLISRRVANADMFLGAQVMGMLVFGGVSMALGLHPSPIAANQLAPALMAGGAFGAITGLTLTCMDPPESIDRRPEATI